MQHQKIKIHFSGLIFALVFSLSCGIFGNATPSPPTPIPPAEADLSGVLLTLDDLPPGFIQLSLTDLGISLEELNLETITLENLFIFLHPEKLEFVLGLITEPLSPLQIVAFEAAMQTPEILIDPIVSAMGGAEILQQQEIPGLNNIGDTSIGYSLVVNMNTIPTGLDVVVFREEVFGAGVINLYVAGGGSSVDIGALAQTLDNRIVAALNP